MDLEQDSVPELVGNGDPAGATVVALRAVPAPPAATEVGIDQPLAPDQLTTAAAALVPVAELQRREQVYRWLLALADVVAACVATVAAMQIWRVGEQWPFLFLPVYAVLVNKVQGLYDRDEMVLRKSTVGEWRRVLQASILVAAGVYIGWHTVTNSDQFRHFTLFLLVTFVTFAVALLGRALARVLARSVTVAERCLVVGNPVDCEDLVRRIDELPHAEVVGTTPVTELGWTEITLAELVSKQRVHRIVVGPYGSWHEPSVLELVRHAKWLGVRVSLMPSVMAVVGASTAIDSLDSTVLLGVPRFGLSRSSLAIKRTLDLTFAVLWLIVLAPLWLLVAAAIRLDSRGPVLFRQTRVGRDGVRFKIVKFRSMVDGAEALQAELEPLNEAGEGFFKISNDPRITRVGKLIRRTYIDELPQLLNILRGEMSFVGPRPLAESEDALLTGFDRHRSRLAPGLTGPWQLLGPMHAPLEEMVKLDYMYASNWSIWVDVDILIGTVVRVLTGRGH